MIDWIRNIKDGWKNYFKYIKKDNLDPEIERQALERAEICSSCPELVPGDSLVKLVNVVMEGVSQQKIIHISEKSKADGKDYKCNKCGCPDQALFFSPNKECPLGKWHKMKLDESTSR